MMVGKGKIKKKDLEEIIKLKKRGAAGQTAPAHGLFLYSIAAKRTFSGGGIV